MREWLEYALSWGLLKFLGVLPRPLARWTAATMTALALLLRPAWRRTAMFNLRLAFPDWEESQRQQTLRRMIRNLGWVAAEFAHFPSLSKRNLEEVVVLEGAGNLASAEQQGRGV